MQAWADRATCAACNEPTPPARPSVRCAALALARLCLTPLRLPVLRRVPVRSQNTQCMKSTNVHSARTLSC